jgi:hypothetical protein
MKVPHDCIQLRSSVLIVLNIPFLLLLYSAIKETEIRREGERFAKSASDSHGLHIIILPTHRTLTRFPGTTECTRFIQLVVFFAWDFSTRLQPAT